MAREPTKSRRDAGENLAASLVKPSGDGAMNRPQGGYASANLTHHLEGAEFPASKQDLLRRARDSGAGQDALELLESLPEDAEFESLADVVEATRYADQAPQTGIIDKKP